MKSGNDMTKPAGLGMGDWLAQSAERHVLDLSAIDVEALPADWRPTAAYRLILDRYAYARATAAPLALITGAHGVGKSTTLRLIAQSNDVLYWECRPKYKAGHVLADIAQQLGINAGSGWQMQTSIVAEQLAVSPRVVILDEAQRLDYDGLDLLKFLADQTQSTFVLSASPSLETRIERWPDIASRTTVRVRVSTMSLDEFLELYQADGFTGDALGEIHRLSGGVMRSVIALLREVDAHLASYNSRQAASVTRGDLLPGQIRIIAQKVL